jgi:hypothetical protein
VKDDQGQGVVGPAEEQLLKPAEVAKRLRVSKSWVYSAASSSPLSGHTNSSSVPVSSVVAHVELLSAADPRYPLLTTAQLEAVRALVLQVLEA